MSTVGTYRVVHLGSYVKVLCPVGVGCAIGSVRQAGCQRMACGGPLVETCHLQDSGWVYGGLLAIHKGHCCVGGAAAVAAAGVGGGGEGGDVGLLPDCGGLD